MSTRPARSVELEKREREREGDVVLGDMLCVIDVRAVLVGSIGNNKAVSKAGLLRLIRRFLDRLMDPSRTRNSSPQDPPLDKHF